MDTKQQTTNRPADLAASTARVRALATEAGVSASALYTAETRAGWTICKDAPVLERLGVKAASELEYEVKMWAVTCLAVQAELVVIFAQEIEHTNAVRKAAAMVRKAAA